MEIAAAAVGLLFFSSFVLRCSEQFALLALFSLLEIMEYDGFMDKTASSGGVEVHLLGRLSIPIKAYNFGQFESNPNL